MSKTVYVRKHNVNLTVVVDVYVTDFIIMAGALFWYNKYHITSSRRSKKTIKLEP
jgi:hypothetical protein